MFINPAGGWRFELCSSAKKEVQLHWKHPRGASATPIISTLPLQGWSSSSSSWLCIWSHPRSSSCMAFPSRHSNSWIHVWPPPPISQQPSSSIEKHNTLHEQPWSPPLKASFSRALCTSKSWSAAAAARTWSSRVPVYVIPWTARFHGDHRAEVGGQGGDWWS